MVLLERKRLTSGTTWHAAGLITQARPTYGTREIVRRSLRVFQTAGGGDRLRHRVRADRDAAPGRRRRTPGGTAPAGLGRAGQRDHRRADLAGAGGRAVPAAVRRGPRRGGVLPGRRPGQRHRHHDGPGRGRPPARRADRREHHGDRGHPPRRAGRRRHHRARRHRGRVRGGRRRHVGARVRRAGRRRHPAPGAGALLRHHRGHPRPAARPADDQDAPRTTRT